MREVRWLVLMLCLLNTVPVLAMRSREEMGVKPIQKKPAATKPVLESPAQVTPSPDKSKALKTEETEPSKEQAPADTPESGQKKPD